jgi:hypothetical protein
VLLRLRSGLSGVLPDFKANEHERGQYRDAPNGLGKIKHLFESHGPFQF